MNKRPSPLNLTAMDKAGIAMPKSNLSPAHTSSLLTNRIADRRRNKSESEMLSPKSPLASPSAANGILSRSFSFSSK